MKPYLNENEAVDYCGCSKAHFVAKWKPYLNSRALHGKVYYMTADLKKEMGRLWQLSSGEEKTKTLPTSQIGEYEKHLEEYLKNRLKKNYVRGMSI